MDKLMVLGVRQDGNRIVVSSRTVAVNFEKRHDHVLRDIDEILVNLPKFGEIDPRGYFLGSTYLDSRNRAYPEYLLTRDGFTLLTMGWTGEKAMQFKLAYINEFNRMEQALKDGYQLPATYAEALRLAADQAEQIEKQTKQLEVAKPKVQFFDAVASSKDAIPIGEAAKVLNIRGIGRNRLFAFLRERDILMANNIPYQTYIDRGYFRTIEQKWTTPEGETKISIKTLVYQKGLSYIHKLLTEDSQLRLTV